jgi:hypothetical protein
MFPAILLVRPRHSQKRTSPRVSCRHAGSSADASTRNQVVDRAQMRNATIMTTSSRLAVPNALILISDVGGGTAPDIMRRTLIASTPSCIAVGCMSDCNGETEVTLGATQEIGRRHRPAFEGELATPNRAIAVRTVLRGTISQVRVPDLRTKVRVWVNHPQEPDKVIIGWG